MEMERRTPSSSTQHDSDTIEAQASDPPRGTKRPAQTQGRASSCAECRRLKLKCDRGSSETWPCVQCRRRKCAELCPGSVSTPTAKAGNEKLLRHYRSKIASLEARLSAVTAQSDRASLRDVASPPTTYSEMGRQHTEARNFSAPSSTGSHRQDCDARTPDLQAQLETSAQREDEANQTSRDGQPSHSLPANLDPSFSASRQPMDELYWPENVSSAAQVSSIAPQRESSSSTSAVSASLPAPFNASPMESGSAAQPTQPSGPIYFGSSAGVLYRQPDSENVSVSTSLRLNCTHISCRRVD